MGIGTNALQANIGLFSKVYFPRLIPPLGQAISALLNFFIQLTVLFAAIMVYRAQIPDCTSGPLPTIFPSTITGDAICSSWTWHWLYHFSCLCKIP